MRHFFIICIIVVILFLFITSNSSRAANSSGEDTDAIQYTTEYIQKQLYYQAILILEDYASRSSTNASYVQSTIDNINNGNYFIYVYLSNSNNLTGYQALNNRSYTSFFDASTYSNCYVFVRLIPLAYQSYSSISYDSFYNLYPSTSTTYTCYSYGFDSSYDYFRQNITLSTNSYALSHGTSSGNIILPVAFFGYMPDFFREWCSAYGTSSADDIVESIEEQTESVVESIEQQTDEITDSIDEQTQQQQEQYEEFTSEEYDEDEVDDTISDLSSISDDVDDSEFSGFFESLFDMFYNAFCDVEYYEVVSVAIPFTDQYLTFESDVIKNVIQDTALYTFIQLLYSCLFGLWAFRFAYGVVCSIKDGTILDGDITSSGDEMLSELYGVKVNQSNSKEDKK